MQTHNSLRQETAIYLAIEASGILDWKYQTGANPAGEPEPEA